MLTYLVMLMPVISYLKHQEKKVYCASVNPGERVSHDAGHQVLPLNSNEIKFLRSKQ